MANTKNLRPIKLSHEEAVENGRKGGKASVEARRKKKTMRELAQTMANAPVTQTKNRAVLEQLGLEEDEMVNSALVVAGVLKSAQSGNISAVEKWEQMTTYDKDEDESYELPASVMGKAFVDINREIEPNKAYTFEGGRGSLKSTYVSEKILELMKIYPYLHSVIVRKVASTLKDSVYAQMIWSIYKLGLMEEFDLKKSPLEITYKKTGQNIYFRGVDEPTKLKGIKVPFGYIGILWKEEGDQLNGEEEERSINQSVLRGGNISFDFMSYNPPKSKSNWVHKRKLNHESDPNYVFHRSTYLEAPKAWLGQKFIDDAEHLKEVNPDAYEHEYLGVANGDGGNVFTNVEFRAITDEEIQAFDNIRQGVDWGWYPDPFAFIRSHYDPARETIYLIDEHKANKTANSVTGQWIIDKGYNDFEVTCDSAEKKSTNDYRDLGINAKNAVKGAGSIDYGMKWLQVRKLVIDPQRTPNAYQEIVNYEYERDKDGNVISGYPDHDNHFIDALRYSYERYYNKRGTSA